MLIKAYWFSEDFIRDGVPIWWDESDEVFFEVEKRISRSRAAVERTQDSENGKDKKAPAGRYYIPTPKTRGGAEFPSFEDWVAEQERKKGRK